MTVAGYAMAVANRMKRIMKTAKDFCDELALILLFVALAVICLIGAFLWNSPGSDDVDAAQYCQFVHDGTWPDYRHIYAKQCHVDGTVDWDYVYGRKP